jgi:Nitroreductase family
MRKQEWSFRNWRRGPRSRAASSLNLQPWNVYAVTGRTLNEIKRLAMQTIEQHDWRTLATEYPEFPAELWEPYRSRGATFGAQLYSSLGISRDDQTGRLQQIKRNFQFFGAPVGIFVTIDRRLGCGPRRTLVQNGHR